MTTNEELRRPAGVATSFRQQLWLLARSGRLGLLIVGLLLVLVIARRVELSGELGASETRRFFFASMVALGGAPLWALVVWYGEWPLRRSYHWSLPVPRAGHDLARVAAGVTYLLVSWSALAIIGWLSRGDTVIGLPALASFFSAPLILYFLITPLVLWSDSRVVPYGFVLILVGAFAVLVEFAPIANIFLAVFESSWGIESAIYGGFREADVIAGPSSATAIWLAIGIASTVFAAIWRPSDLARLATRG